VISASALTKTYVSKRAVDHFSLSVNEGESIALVGANGSGKTTLIHLLLGLTAPDSPPDGGESRIFDTPSLRLSTAHKQRIGYISDDSAPMPWARLRDLRGFYRRIYTKWDDDAFQERVREWQLDTSRRLCEMSKGQRRLAEIALVTSYAPDILILDEPFNGLDPIHRHQIARLLRRMNEERGMLLFYSTHVLPEIPKLADRLILIKDETMVIDAAISSLPESVEDTFYKEYCVE